LYFRSRIAAIFARSKKKTTMPKDFLQKNWIWLIAGALIVWYFFFYKKKPALTPAVPGTGTSATCTNDVDKLSEAYGNWELVMPGATAEDYAFQMSSAAKNNKTTDKLYHAFDRETLLSFFRGKNYGRTFLTSNFDGLRCDL
jgi:hypothetical protein